MKEIKLYREDNGQYSTSEARQDDVSGPYVQKTDYDELMRENSELKLALGIASAFPVKVRMECRKVIDSKLSSLEFLSVLCDSANRAISESSCDQLAGIKADAITDLINEAAHCAVIDGTATTVIDVNDAIKYAEGL